MDRVNIEPEKVIKKISRAFGFGYPARVLILHDRGSDEERYMEDPKFHIKKVKLKDVGTVINTIAQDPETNEVIQIRGDVRRHLKPMRIVDIYPEGALALLLPGFLIYTLILLWMFGAIKMGMGLVMLITFLMATMFFQGRLVYHDGGILALDLAEKGNISGFRLYVPMVAQYLDLHPHEDKAIIHDSIKRLVAFFKPVMAENKLLTSEIQKMADGYSKSFLLGLRMRKGYMDLTEKYPAWVWLIIGIVAGILMGIMITGGVAPAPPPGGTP